MASISQQAIYGVMALKHSTRRKGGFLIEVLQACPRLAIRADHTRARFTVTVIESLTFMCSTGLRCNFAPTDSEQFPLFGLEMHFCSTRICSVVWIWRAWMSWPMSIR
jgi:hypothetical protein